MCSSDLVPGWGTVPKDNGRPFILGWEFEGGYLPYTDEMHDFMARCGAGSLDWLGTLPGNPGPAPLECHDEHKGWAGPRKPDRVGYTTASGRQRIAAIRNSPTPVPTVQEDDDMPTAISITVPAGERRHVAFPPAEGGAAGWGPGWLTIRTDCFTEPPAPVKVRLALQGGDGKYRAVPGTRGFDTTVDPGLGLSGVRLAKGDCGLVVTATTQPVSVLIEYAKP